jgi:acyl-CoA synthetase (AMP-forming)/AMP-acid ligase II
MNLMMLLEMASSGFGDRVAVRSGAASLTYSQLFAAAGAAAQEIASSGCERMALLDVSSLAVPVGLFASSWAGVPFVPLNYRLTGAELDRLVEEIAPSYLVTDDERAEDLARLS